MGLSGVRDDEDEQDEDEYHSYEDSQPGSAESIITDEEEGLHVQFGLNLHPGLFDSHV